MLILIYVKNIKSENSEENNDVLDEKMSIIHEL